MTTVYIQARYVRIQEMRKVAAQFEARGYSVISSWLRGSDVDVSSQDAASMDVREVEEADVSVHFAEATHSSGRYFELGYAYALGRPCIIVGEGKCVFYLLPRIHRCADVSSAIDWLDSINSNTGGSV